MPARTLGFNGWNSLDVANCCEHKNTRMVSEAAVTQRSGVRVHACGAVHQPSLMPRLSACYQLSDRIYIEISSLGNARQCKWWKCGRYVPTGTITGSRTHACQLCGGSAMSSIITIIRTKLPGTGHAAHKRRSNPACVCVCARTHTHTHTHKETYTNKIITSYRLI